MTPPADTAAMAVAARGAGPAVAAARRALAAQLRVAGIDSPELDARILVGHVLGLDSAALAAAGDRSLTAAEAARLATLARRRLVREPVARILGHKEFWSLPLRLDVSTLVPRPETETVVEAALSAIDKRGPRTQPLRLADLGTGSGAILLALLSELPNASGIGIDLSVEAVRVARDNARRLGLSRARFVAGDMTAVLRGPFDVIVSNPPYVASAAIATLAPEVRDFEPHRAVDGGPDGLAFYRAIAAAVPSVLAPRGAVIVELGIDQAAAVAALFAAAGLAPLPPHPDLYGLPRALTAEKGHDCGALGHGKKALGILRGTD